MYGREDALVFEKINYLVIWFLVLNGKFDALARRVVRLPGAPERSHDEIVAMLRERVQPIRGSGA